MITPGRKVHLYVDVEDSAILSPSFQLERRMNQIAGNKALEDFRVTFKHGFGWTLASKIQNLSKTHRSDTPAATLIDSSNATIATGLVQKKTFRQQTDKPWVGSSLALIADGDPVFAANYGAGETSAIGIPGSHNQADSANFAVPMDAWIKTTAPHLPTEPISLRFMVPGAGIQSHERLVSIYFTGPQSFIESFTGLGQYALHLNGDGLAELWEYGKTNASGESYWKEVFRFNYAQPHSVSGAWHSIGISSDAWLDSSSNYNGTGIFFSHISVPLQTVSTAIGGAIASAINLLDETPVVYNTGGPNQDPSGFPLDTQNLRIDVRRDLDVRVQARVDLFNTEGVVYDHPFALNGITSNDELLSVYFEGNAPPGCDVDAAVYDQSGSPLAVSVAKAVISDYGWVTTFELPSGYSGVFYPRYTLTSDGTARPVLKGSVMAKNPKSQAINVASATEIIGVTSWDVRQATDDPSDSIVNITVSDPTGNNSVLRLRAGMPFRLETEYDPGDPSARAILASGYLQSAVFKRVGSDADDRRAVPGWGKYVIRCTGQWTRLAELVTAQSFNCGNDPESPGNPYKVTNIIRWLFISAGYAPGELDIPDLPTRFFPTDGEYLIESYGDVYAKARELAEVYLGAYLYWDDAAGTRGKWRLLNYPSAPYLPLAEFHESLPEATSTPTLVARPWPDSIGGDMQTIKNTFVQHGSLSEHVTPPEANHFIVYGTGTGSPLATSSDPNAAVLAAEAYNFRSALFFDDQPIAPDPSSRDYLGREKLMVVFNKSLNSPEAVQFYCRRLYERSSYGVHVVTFDSPLVLVEDPSDTEQNRPRPLRYGDQVLFRGDVYIVRFCDSRSNRDKGGDGFQWATYQIESARDPVDLVTPSEEIGS